MDTNFSEQGQALHDELSDSLAVFQERCYQKADFLKNEFLTKLNSLMESGILSNEEADRLKQACDDRVRNVFVMYDDKRS